MTERVGLIPRAGLERDFLVHLGGEAGAALEPGMPVTYTDTDGLARTVAMVVVVAGSDGEVDLIEVLRRQGPSENRVAYAFCRVESAERRTVHGFFGSDDRSRVWGNGKQVHEFVERDRGVNPEEDQFSFDLKAGVNRILVKVENGGGRLGIREAAVRRGNPGRYLAYVEAQPAHGPVIRRALTYFVTPPGFEPWRAELRVPLPLLSGAGIDAAVWEEAAGAVARFGGQMLMGMLYNDPAGAYSRWQGRDIATTEPFDIASISKLITGTLLVQFLDQNLAGRCLEAVAGRTFARLMYEELFGPLGMDHTTVFDTAYGIRTTARDLARFGQLLLNRGVYGDQEFFSPEAFEHLLPVRVGDVQPGCLTPDVVYGLGSTWERGPVDPDAPADLPDEARSLLGWNTLSHGSATRSILRVDYDNDLVITMCRPMGGPDYDDHWQPILRCIAAHLLPAKPPAGLR